MFRRRARSNAQETTPTSSAEQPLPDGTYKRFKPLCVWVWGVEWEGRGRGEGGECDAWGKPAHDGVFFLFRFPRCRHPIHATCVLPTRTPTPTCEHTATPTCEHTVTPTYEHTVTHNQHTNTQSHTTNTHNQHTANTPHTNIHHCHHSTTPNTHSLRSFVSSFVSSLRSRMGAACGFKGKNVLRGPQLTDNIMGGPPRVRDNVDRHDGANTADSVFHL